MISSAHRFHGPNSLRAVYRSGRTKRGADISLRYTPSRNPSGYRAAVVISKKIHKSAVKRNRVRRRIYEVIRLMEPSLGSYDIIFSVFNDRVIDWPPAKLTGEIHRLLENAGIIKPAG